MDNVIGVDIGYGQTKTYNSSGAKSFPTAVTSMVPVETFGKVQAIVVNGEKYLVGDDACESRWVVDTRTPSFLGSNAWLASLGLALMINGFTPEDVKTSQIVLGIPPGHFKKDTVRKIANAVKSATISKNGQAYDLCCANVSVIPQGAGIYYAYKARDEEAKSKNIAIVDIGHYTIDMVYFAHGKYVEDATNSIEMGISLLLDNICTAFNREYDVSINHMEAQRLFANGTITIFQEVYRLEEMPSILQAYSSKVAAIINRFFAGLAGKPDIAIAGGGGALALQGNISLQHKVLTISEPVVANAKGYYYFGVKRKAA